MRRYHSWLAALSLAAATPGLALGGPLSLFSGDRDSKATSESDTKAYNEKVARDIAKALGAAKLKGYDIDVIFEKGTATIIGEVPTAQQREAASIAAKQVPGVKSVVNQLKVQQQVQRARPTTNVANRRPQAPIQQVGFDDARTAAVADTNAADHNQEMADQIASSLRDAKFTGVDVGIQFQEGTATITGSVTDDRRRAAASTIIGRIRGVKRVDNQLTVAVAQAPQRRAARPIQQVQYDESMNQAGPMGPPMTGPMQGAPMQGPPPGYQAYPAGAMMQGGQPPAPMYGAMQMNGSNPAIYDQPNLPEHAWPAYASYPNYAAVSYPKQYSASAWPYIGPFYPYPQVPLGWRKVQLEWDDGYWQLNFRPRTERWWWFMNPHNW